MVSGKVSNNFIFDYGSAFEYGAVDLKMKTFNRGPYRSAFTYHSVPLYVDENSDGSVAKETWPSLLIRRLITYFVYMLVILVFPISAWVCIKRVHALERIVTMRLGKMQPIKGPGIALILPFIDKWSRVDLRPLKFNITTTQLLTSDGAIVEAQTEIEYRVTDVVHYVIRLANQESSLKDLSMSCLVNLVSEKDQEDLERHADLINATLKDELNRTVMNWGLEILHVHLCDINVLKQAEPVDAMGTLMTALKAATGQSDNQTAAVCPFLGNAPMVESQTASLDSADVAITVDAIETIRNLAETALLNGDITDMKSLFKLNITGMSPNTIYCCFENGTVSVFEDDVNSILQPDITLTLSEENLRDFLSHKMSPLQAYMDGKITVSGDWQLLRSFAKVFR